MAMTVLSRLKRQTEELTADEQLQLAAYLVEQARRRKVTGGTVRTWQSIRGAAPYPLLGEDAQTWVSQSRREADEHRGMKESER